MSGWPSGRARHGGVDEVPVPGVPGRLWLCGKHAVGLDPETLVAEVGEPAVVVCLTERSELADRYPDYVDWLRRHEGSRTRWFPIPDLHAPPLEDLRPLLEDVAVLLRAGQRVVLHCAAGIGRAGTVAIAVLMTLGVAREEATALVAAHRPMAGPEAGAQRDLLVALEASLGDGA